MELVKETKREKRKKCYYKRNENKERRNGRVEKKVEKIVKLTRAVAKVEGIKKIGKKIRTEEKWSGLDLKMWRRSWK